MNAQITNNNNTAANNASGNNRTYAMVDNMLNMFTVGVACVRTNGEIMYANQAAQAMLNRCSILLAQCPHTHAEGRINDSTLRKLALDTQQTTVIRHQNIELQIQVEPFQNIVNGDADETERRHGAMLILRESGSVALPSIEQLISLYGLTQAEARLALKLCNGDTPAECAKCLNVSISTIRTQLRAVLEKTGSHRQAELLTKLLSSPSTSVRSA